MVYQALSNKFAWAPAVDNMLKAIRGTGIVDVDGFKVENSEDSDLTVRIPLGGAGEIQGTSVYWSDLLFNLDKLYEVNSMYTSSSSTYSLNTTATAGALKQKLEPIGGWVKTIKCYASVTGTLAVNLTVGIYNETDAVMVTTGSVEYSSITSTVAEQIVTLSTPVCLNSSKIYSLVFYRSDNTSPTDVTHYDGSNYFNIAYSPTTYSYVSSYYAGSSTWTDKTYPLSFYIGKYDYTWVSETQSAISLDSSIYNSAPYSLKWIYTDDGVTQYNNNVYRYFGYNKQDWSKRNTLRFKFYPVTTIQNPISVYINNNGSDYLVGTIPVTLTTGTFNTVELTLPSYRDAVSYMYFNIDGNQWTTGSYTFYIDDINVYEKLSFTAPSTVNYERIDLVYLDSTGTVSVKTGTEVNITEDTPMPQDLDLDEIGLALIMVKHGYTSFGSNDIIDIRSPLNE